jgi:hypothetical protein
MNKLQAQQILLVGELVNKKDNKFGLRSGMVLQMVG